MLLSVLVLGRRAAAADAPTAGKPVDDRPHAFFPDRWVERKVSFRLFPWVGRDVVLLTTKDDLDADTRRQIEAAEGAYVGTDLSFVRAFTTRGGLDEKEPRLPGVAGPSDQPVIYASAMLKLYRELGGKTWLRAFSRELLLAPEVPPTSAAAALSQARAWLVAASIAAGKDLSPVFVDRWRLPMGPKARKALAGIRWTNKDLHVPAVLRRLPADDAR